MSVILQRDTLKIQINKKTGIGLMIFSGLLLSLIIITNIYWLKNYDENYIKGILVSRKTNPTLQNMNTYVRMRVIFAIIGNTFVLGFFSGMVWYSISKRRVGLGFGIFWLFLFGTNSIATPFYSLKTDSLAILALISNIMLTIYMVVWIAQLLTYRQRLRQEIASRRK